MSKTQPGDLVVIAAVIIMAVFIDIVRGNAEARSRRFAMARKRRNNIFFSPVSAAARRTLCRRVFSGEKMCRPVFNVENHVCFLCVLSKNILSRKDCLFSLYDGRKQKSENRSRNFVRGIHLSVISQRRRKLFKFTANKPENQFEKLHLETKNIFQIHESRTGK